MNNYFYLFIVSFFVFQANAQKPHFPGVLPKNCVLDSYNQSDQTLTARCFQGEGFEIENLKPVRPYDHLEFYQNELIHAVPPGQWRSYCDYRRAVWDGNTLTAICNNTGEVKSSIHDITLETPVRIIGAYLTKEHPVLVKWRERCGIAGSSVLMCLDFCQNSNKGLYFQSNKPLAQLDLQKVNPYCHDGNTAVDFNGVSMLGLNPEEERWIDNCLSEEMGYGYERKLEAYDSSTGIGIVHRSIDSPGYAHFMQYEIHLNNFLIPIFRREGANLVKKCFNGKPALGFKPGSKFLTGITVPGGDWQEYCGVSNIQGSVVTFACRKPMYGGYHLNIGSKVKEINKYCYRTGGWTMAGIRLGIEDYEVCELAIKNYWF